MIAIERIKTDESVWPDGLPQAGEVCQILDDFHLCGNQPLKLKKGDHVIVHGHVDLGFGLVCVISDTDIRGAGTIIGSQLAPTKTRDEREREELTKVVAQAAALKAGVVLDPEQYDDIADAIIKAGFRKSED